MTTISSFLMYQQGAEQAAELYVSLLPDSRILGIQRGPEGEAQIITLELDGIPVSAYNGGPHFQFTEAFSFMVTVDTQDEIDHLWDALIANGGSPSQCGWLKDPWGLSWQIIPSVLLGLIGGPDPEAAGRAAQAMFGMQKLDIAALQAAYDGA